MLDRVAKALAALVVCGVSAAAAQTPAQTGTARQPAGQQPATSTAEPVAVETRPATSTHLGDTGLWFVPTGEVLPARKWSVSLFRSNFDYEQGFSDV
ncbi:MAG TPA: hypothetical protein VK886_18045, partial [Vicinamibacterales bacterium]|nr:hypothetical protein [Vicinamibacterales bacterium]